MARAKKKIPELPVFMNGATLFSADPELVDPLWVVRLLKNKPEFRAPLNDAARTKGSWGRPGLEGNWTLAYLAFVCSGKSDIKPWWAGSGEPLWQECGFDERPSYDAVRKNFIRLEEHSGLFT
ncbi:MAG: hypothetical protein WCK97_09975, partial [Actinomycetes bacterium]